MLNMDLEPSIQKVQEIAVDYAEVNPEKIKRWRTGAKWKALLPRVTMGMDTGSSDTYEIYTSSTRNYWVNGPKDETSGIDINLTWDLSDLIYNETQTIIDTRSKLMVQLRTDILSDVTRIYFERKRLQYELESIPLEDNEKYFQKQLRIHELSAYLDSYTGGWFTQQLQVSEKK